MELKSLNLKTLSKLLSIFLVSVFACICLSGCSLIKFDTDSISIDFNSENPVKSKTYEQEQVIKKYYQSTNDCNIEGMLSVCDTNSKNMINGSTYLLQLLLDSTGQNNVNVRDFYMSLFPSLKSFLGKNNVTFSVKPSSIEVSEKDKTHCSATVMVHYDIVDNGKPTSLDSRDELNLVKEGNDWKIDISKEMQNAASLGLDLGLGLFGF